MLPNRNICNKGIIWGKHRKLSNQIQRINLYKVNWGKCTRMAGSNKYKIKQRSFILLMVKARHRAAFAVS